MQPIQIDDTRLKALLKSALVEVFEEKKELISEIVADALEDFALLQAIKEGEKIGPVRREEIFQVLPGEND